MEPIKDQVKLYLRERWDELEESKPEWWNAGFISQIPDFYIPRDKLSQLNEAAGGKRRRSNISVRARSVMRQ